jgi:hypothetical protein
MNSQSYRRNRALSLPQDCPTASPAATFQVFRAPAAHRTWLAERVPKRLRDRFHDERDSLKGVVWPLGLETVTAHGGYGYGANITGQIARICTDLDAFSDAEMAILENQGYLVAAACIAERLPELLPADTPPLRVPHPDLLDPARAEHALRWSHLRLPIVGRFRWQRPGVSTEERNLA